LEHWGSKFDTAGAAAEGFFSKRWIASNVFNISDDEFLRNQREMYYDRIFEAELEAVATAAGESAATESASAEEGMGGELGGEEEMDLGGDEELGGELGGEDLGGEELGGEEMGGEEEGTLLAAPGKRDEEDWYKLKKRDQGKIKTTTSDSKDKWYEPKKHRGGDRRNAGARLRSNKAKYADEKGRAVKRNLFPGLSGLSSLSSGIYEQKDTNYEEQEEKLFKANADVKRLITELELKNKDDEVKT